MTKFASRKFQLAVWLGIVVCYMFVFKLLDQAAFIDLLKWIFGGYLGANVAHFAVATGLDYLKGKHAEPGAD